MGGCGLVSMSHQPICCCLLDFLWIQARAVVPDRLATETKGVCVGCGCGVWGQGSIDLLSKTLKRSLRPLYMLVFVTCIGMLLFATVMCVARHRTVPCLITTTSQLGAR